MLLALATVYTTVDTVPVTGPAGVYTVKTTGPTRITGGTGWVQIDWDVDGQVVKPPRPAPSPAPLPAPPPAPAPVAAHTGHFTVSYIEPRYPSPASGAVRDGLAKTDWTPLDATYRSYTEGQSQITSLGFTPHFKTSDLPIVMLQEDGPSGSPIIDKLKSPPSAEAVVNWVKGFRGQ